MAIKEIGDVMILQKT